MSSRGSILFKSWYNVAGQIIYTWSTSPYAETFCNIMRWTINDIRLYVGRSYEIVEYIWVFARKNS